MVSLRPQGLRNFEGKNFLGVIGSETLLYNFYDEKFWFISNKYYKLIKMYCETCHLELKKAEFIVQMKEISSHMDHKFVSLTLFKGNKLPAMIETKKSQMHAL